VGQARKPTRQAYPMFQPGRYVFYFCHGLHGFSRKNQKGQMGNPCNLWLKMLCYFVPSCLRGSFEKTAAQKYDAHPKRRGWE